MRRVFISSVRDIGPVRDMKFDREVKYCISDAVYMLKWQFSSVLLEPGRKASHLLFLIIFYD